ncbi:HAD superfamily (subfamily IA) hydrolase, TIGR01548 [Halothece sp. PCC 7418]|uniref:TIGR01548 family HAD-type hydrolase n=1 Tax=Halothece sp. (strain PCC 7418) TaxID=65093 RepID=UPI0002A05B24|nr:TIGR01548 family HAD-type hydrolase [Halothece sp. PCC 7418]AFZ44135.1 HAD superfamily (subfamily IA) hydrolase, TIGR01548 [Halothece sp. PCC 7418]
MSSPQAIVIFDIDGVVRDVAGSYRRAIADTVEQLTNGAYRPSPEAIDDLKGEGIWNNDWEASRELVYRYFESQGEPRQNLDVDYTELIAFFQSRYRGTDPDHWDGYITDEPLLMSENYLQALTSDGILWGFFSGAPRASAHYVLQQRLGLRSPLIVAMEDAPGKPDPTGLFATVEQLDPDEALPVFYAGDTVADMQTIQNAQLLQPHRKWCAIGILPPHLLNGSSQRVEQYQQKLQEAGAMMVLKNVEELSSKLVQEILT